MKLKLFLSAVFRFRNIAILLLALGAASIVLESFSGISPWAAYLVSLSAYVASLVQTLTNREFHEKFNHKQKVKQIQNLNFICLRLSSEAKRHLNTAQNQKLRKIMEDKDDIVNSFFRGERSFLKEKVVEQTLNLVASYIRLLMNYAIRSKELEEMDISEVANRINLNTRKLNFEKDPSRLDDLRKVIDMDQKIITTLKEEKKNLEGISAKLDYMSSAVNMFKHQIMSSIESEDMLEQLQTVLNEAEALDNVLYERRKNRVKL
ncbi:MAG TPA: hypothetical protein GXX20_06180 [Clostridiaceae bacterium]|nr:hypothetical protein [Clostridiaceae bacterium]